MYPSVRRRNSHASSAGAVNRITDGLVANRFSHQSVKQLDNEPLRTTSNFNTAKQSAPRVHDDNSLVIMDMGEEEKTYVPVRNRSSSGISNASQKNITPQACKDKKDSTTMAQGGEY